eukprot:c17744_g1_i1.p1 GENE.c17744_g1_i1~~c17744_g1_i1.p1  ORF type:complete len:981 (+),score=194.80 c17744_g1_i1:58-3000(+)
MSVEEVPLSVVHVSSENEIHEANNVLNKDMFRMWQSNGDQKKATICLECPPTKIQAVYIVNCFSAFIEIFLGTCDNIQDPNTVALARITSMRSIADVKAKRNPNGQKTFDTNSLPDEYRKRAYSFITIICTQPFIPTCPIGLTYIRVIPQSAKSKPALSPIAAAALTPSSPNIHANNQNNANSSPVSNKHDDTTDTVEIDEPRTSPNTNSNKPSAITSAVISKAVDKARETTSQSSPTTMDAFSEYREHHDDVPAPKPAPAKQTQKAPPATKIPNPTSSSHPPTATTTTLSSNTATGGVRQLPSILSSMQPTPASKPPHGGKPKKMTVVDDDDSSLEVTGSKQPHSDPNPKPSVQPAYKSANPGPPKQAPKQTQPQQQPAGTKAKKPPAKKRKGKAAVDGEDDSGTDGTVGSLAEFVVEEEDSEWSGAGDDSGSGGSRGRSRGTRHRGSPAVRHRVDPNDGTHGPIVPLGSVLDGAVIAVSGIQDRSKIKESISRMGGEYSFNWTPQCTHLISAGFQNVAKVQDAMRDRKPVVSVNWLEDCEAYNRLMRCDCYPPNTTPTNSGGGGGGSGSGVRTRGQRSGRRNNAPTQQHSNASSGHVPNPTSTKSKPPAPKRHDTMETEEVEAILTDSDATVPSDGSPKQKRSGGRGAKRAAPEPSKRGNWDSDNSDGELENAKRRKPSPQAAQVNPIAKSPQQSFQQHQHQPHQQLQPHQASGTKPLNAPSPKLSPIVAPSTSGAASPTTPIKLHPTAATNKNNGNTNSRSGAVQVDSGDETEEGNSPQKVDETGKKAPSIQSKSHPGASSGVAAVVVADDETLPLSDRSMSPSPVSPPATSNSARANLSPPAPSKPQQQTLKSSPVAPPHQPVRAPQANSNNKSGGGGNVEQWTAEMVQDWLKSKGFKADILTSFEENCVDGCIMLSLTDEDLKADLNIDKGVMRRRILKDIAELKAAGGGTRVMDQAEIEAAMARVQSRVDHGEV